MEVALIYRNKGRGGSEAPTDLGPVTPVGSAIFKTLDNSKMDP